MKENLASLPTREIDALVDKNIFGRDRWAVQNWQGIFRDKEGFPSSYAAKNPYLFTKQEAELLLQTRADGGSIHQHPFSPSTSITHAMEVVEKIESNAIYLNKIDGEWFCTFWLKNDVAFQASAPTLSIAICLAALECKGGV